MQTEEMSPRQIANMQRLFRMPFAELYPLYLTKVSSKNRSEAELISVLSWLTGYSQAQLDSLCHSQITLAEFFDGSELNPHAQLITGTVCGVKVQEVQDPLMRQIRYMDKLVDELAQGKTLEKIERKPKNTADGAV